MVSHREECCADDTGASIASTAAFVNVRREKDILIIILAGSALDAGIGTRFVSIEWYARLVKLIKA